ncbi:MAG: type II secretion system protein GspG [Myxococcota bacterium]
MRGMTLIEIMVVVAIIALIMGGIGVAAYKQWEKAQLKTARSDALTMATMLEQYRIEHRGNCPSDIAALRAADITKRIRDDPWGTAYAFSCDGSDVVVRSAGPDHEFETDDDIATDDPEEA